MTRPTRVTFSPAIRRTVQARTDGWCGICGCDLLEPDRFAVDHVVPLDAGGSNELENLQPAHTRCNLMKSKRDLPGWNTPSRVAPSSRLGSMVYDLAFPAPRYVEVVRSLGSNPFALASSAPDGGRFIRGMNDAQLSDLLFHGAVLTDVKGKPVTAGRQAQYFIWPHVVARGSRYNGGVYSLICPAKADLAQFGQNRAKGEDETLRRVARAAELWLANAPGCQWPCETARRRLHGGANYTAGGAT